MEIASEMLSQPSNYLLTHDFSHFIKRQQSLTSGGWTENRYESLKIQAIQQSLQALRNVHPIHFPTHHFSV